MKIVGQFLVLCCRKWLSIIPLVFFSILLSSQQFVELQIMDESGSPLIGVSVQYLGTKSGNITNLSGYIKIPYLTKNDQFQISYLGFETVILDVNEIVKINQKLYLASNGILLSRVELIGRTGLDQRDIPYEVQNISSAQIEALASQNSGDAMEQSGDVFLQKSQMGGGSPIMRGFEANKLLLVVDGVRMNNAIYRSGHLQNAITVDAAGLSRIELIYGPNSLLYGSDALGGVIHFKTKDPKLSMDDTTLYNLHAFTRFASVNNGQSYHIDGSIGNEKWGGLLSISYNDFDDLRSGKNRPTKYPDFGKRSFYVDQINGRDSMFINNNPHIQIGTGYKQWDVLSKMIYRPREDKSISSNIQYSNSTNVPRYDQLNRISGGKPKFADWHYGPQERLLLSTTYELKPRLQLYDNIKWIFAYQRIREDRVTRKYQKELETNNEETVNIGSITVDFKKHYGNRYKNRYVVYGAEVNYNDVQSNAFLRNIKTNKISKDITTRYPDGGSNMSQIAAYAIWHYGWNEKGNVEIGARANLSKLNILYADKSIVEWPISYYEGINRQNSAITWSSGWNYRTSDSWHWRALVASAFRSPNVDDFAKIRIKNNQITIPNTTLKPERSYNAEIGLEKTFQPNLNIGSVQFNTTLFYTRLYDLIVRDTFHLNDGSTTWEVDGEELEVTANQNISNGQIFGVSTSLSWKLNEKWQSDIRFNWLQGRTWNADLIKNPLPHIPPMYGNFAVSYTHQKWETGMQIRWNGSKPLSEYALGSSDNEEYATPEGSLAWAIFNIHGSYKFNQHFDAQIKLDNILDLHYRTFASGVSAGGRNIVGTLHYRL